MKQQRLEQLADGIFAIVMTLLVLEIRIPVLPPYAGDVELFIALKPLVPLFLSYVLSFTLLFSYWRSHHFIMSVFAHNVDHKLVNINAVYFFLVALVPFSAQLLGQYSTSTLAVFIFALQFILIGMTMLWMRSYAERAQSINNSPYTHIERRHAYTRMLFPIICAAIAIAVSFFSTRLALFLFTIGILFNLSKRSTRFIFHILARIFPALKEE